MSKTKKLEAQVTRRGVFDMQVCVPAEWTFAQIEQFANAANPCGTAGGWKVRREKRLLCGDPVRNPCEDRPLCVHVMLDC